MTRRVGLHFAGGRSDIQLLQDVRADGAGLEGNIRDAIHRQAGGHFQPEADVAGDGEKSAGHGVCIGCQLGLQGIQEHVGAQLSMAPSCGGG